MKISKINAEHYQWGSSCDGWHLVNHSSVSVIHERMPAGTSEERHVHHQARQFFFVLSGVLTIHVGDNIVVLHQHEGLEIPPYTVHQVINESDTDVEFLVTSQPTTRGDRVRA
ncbi:cupin domain-containing protein [Brevibacillus humidisoli]|uniref:cupin domain-containing protein n=1 Tax=Brevibacillus humidisoli TaxID=2895522 RepID=UPI001E2D160D|nr:cupin domain-containing protein [Brevibacillus humidisoli]UFJ41819.1 cupin domain-containing protein [Brevibacillus humidisoli]